MSLIPIVIEQTARGERKSGPNGAGVAQWAG